MTIRKTTSTVALCGLLATSVTGASPLVPSTQAPPSDPRAQVAYLVDLSSGVELVARNPDRRFVPASITKTMTLFVAFELIAEGKLDPQQEFAISDATFRAWRQKGSTMFIPAGARVPVHDLLLGIANVSANDGSIVLAEGAAGSVDNWVALMNRKARELGMRNSQFGTPNGWADGGRTFTTARDLSLLARALIERHGALYARYIGHAGFTYNGIAQTNHDPMIGRVAGADGIKTGHTGEAGYGYLGTAARGGHRLAVVVAAAETKGARDTLARGLVEWGFATTRTRKLFDAEAPVGEAMVQGGDSLSVPLVTGKLPVVATLPTTASPEIRLTIHYNGPLRAPVEAGEQVAELQIAVEGNTPSRVPLFAGQAVAEARGLDRLRNGVAGLFRW